MFLSGFGQSLILLNCDGRSQGFALSNMEITGK